MLSVAASGDAVRVTPEPLPEFIDDKTIMTRVVTVSRTTLWRWRTRTVDPMPKPKEIGGKHLSRTADVLAWLERQGDEADAAA